MSKKYQNGFFVFGFVLLALMLSSLNYHEVIDGLRHAGYWFFAVVALWGVLYLFNTYTWHIIIKATKEKELCRLQNAGSVEEEESVSSTHKKQTQLARREPSFGKLYRLTVSGFALNYATPGGLMGGEPYRIMALSSLIGAERASSSVILFAMTHIFSHFWFWLLSALLFFATQKVNFFLAIILISTLAFCILGIWFFMVGYRKGLANRALKLLRHFPFVSKWATQFIEKHREELNNIDHQIASLHNQNRKTFLTAVLSELTCRVCSAAEIMFILLVLYPSVNYIHCILILAFTSLFANLLFFMPLQIGGREGGFLMSVKTMAMTTSDGIFVALIVRLRELIWTAIGLLMIKLERRL
ncbi:MAG: flippase-like domain-containing protein [Prevotella sp.]|nr:flippase-like domain-containing protein [Prevotella sp.]